jgi:hypothetical protein
VIDTGKPLNEESYLKWFGWALLTLGRDLEAGHAAAEAACQAEAAGGALAAVQSAARRAGDRPQLAAPAQIALTEWAFWAQTTFGKDQSASLRAARQALAELESTHDLETTTKRMRAALDGESAAMTATPAATRDVAGPAILATEAAVATAPPTATGRVTETPPLGEPTQPRSVKLPFTAWLAVIVVLLVGVGAFLWAFVISPAIVPKAFPPTINATMNGSFIFVTVDNYPANRDVYFFVDGVADQQVSTDGSGHAGVNLIASPGHHAIEACLDQAAYRCPAGTLATK